MVAALVTALACVTGCSRGMKIRVIRRWLHIGEMFRAEFSLSVLGASGICRYSSCPVAVAAENALPLGQTADLIALLIAVIAVTGEFLADRQLARFRLRPENAGQRLLYGALALFTTPELFLLSGCSGGRLWPLHGGLQIAGKFDRACCDVCFLTLSHWYPLRGALFPKRRGEAYRTYQQTTSAFFPWIPHKPRP